MRDEPLVRHGLHFALKAQEDSLRAQASTSGLFAATSARASAKGGLHASLAPTAPAGVYFAQRLGLVEGRRLRNLNNACDVSWMLADRSILDQDAKMTARALRHDVLLLGPAAKRFVKDAVRDSAAWTELKRKEYPQLQQRLRCGSHQTRDEFATVAAPQPLPALSTTTSKDGQATAVPLTAGFWRGPSPQVVLRLSESAASAAATACCSCGGTGVPPAAATSAVVAARAGLQPYSANSGYIGEAARSTGVGVRGLDAAMPAVGFVTGEMAAVAGAQAPVGGVMGAVGEARPAVGRLMGAVEEARPAFGGVMPGVGGAQPAAGGVMPVQRGAQPAVGGVMPGRRTEGGGVSGLVAGTSMTPLPAVGATAETQEQPRRTAKTPAQRQRESRERKRQKRNEERRREEEMWREEAEQQERNP